MAGIGCCVLLRVCLAVLLLSNWAPCAVGIRSQYRLSSDGIAENGQGLPKDQIVENQYGLYEQGDIGNKSGETTNASIGSYGDDIYNYEQDLQYTQISTYLPSGLPVFLVTYTNTGDCSYTNIHVACGQFTNGDLVDPKVFRRLAYNDCLLNNGGPFAPQNSIPFDYISNFPYPMTVSSATPSG